MVSFQLDAFMCERGVMGKEIVCLFESIVHFTLHGLALDIHFMLYYSFYLQSKDDLLLDLL
jgi:hypothetical protein